MYGKSLKIMWKESTSSCCTWIQLLLASSLLRLASACGCCYGIMPTPMQRLLRYVGNRVLSFGLQEPELEMDLAQAQAVLSSSGTVNDPFAPLQWPGINWEAYSARGNSDPGYTNESTLTATSDPRYSLVNPGLYPMSTRTRLV